MAQRKPLKHSGFYRDSNFNIVNMTKGQARKIASDVVKRLNSEQKKLGHKFRYKLLAVTDHGTHWNYTIV